MLASSACVLHKNRSFLGINYLGDVSIDFVVTLLHATYACSFSFFLHVSFLSTRNFLHIDQMWWTVCSPPPRKVEDEYMRYNLAARVHVHLERRLTNQVDEVEWKERWRS